MPDPTTEAACTAAVDLIDVRCASMDHPHRGSHHATRTLDDGTRVSVFWDTPRTATADEQMDGQRHTSTPLEEDAPTPRRMPPRLRRTDYARLSVAGGQVLPS